MYPDFWCSSCSVGPTSKFIFPAFWEWSKKQKKYTSIIHRLSSSSFIKDLFQASQNLGKINSNFSPAGFDFTVIQYQRSRWGSVPMPVTAGSGCQGGELWHQKRTQETKAPQDSLQDLSKLFNFSEFSINCLWKGELQLNLFPLGIWIQIHQWL